MEVEGREPRKKLRKRRRSLSSLWRPKLRYQILWYSTLTTLFIARLSPIIFQKNGVPKSLLKAKKEKEGSKSPMIERQAVEYLPLTRNPQMDEKLSKLFLEKKGKANYQRFQTLRAKLPAVNARGQVLAAIQANQVVLISGPLVVIYNALCLS